MRVVNKSKHIATDNDVYVARPSSLGNPYSHLPGTAEEFKVADRNEAIEKYRGWLETKITDPSAFGHEAVIAAMKMLSEESILVCWCKPKRCHADVVVEMWKKYHRKNECSDDTSP